MSVAIGQWLHAHRAPCVAHPLRFVSRTDSASGGVSRRGSVATGDPNIWTLPRTVTPSSIVKSRSACEAENPGLNLRWPLCAEGSPLIATTDYRLTWRVATRCSDATRAPRAEEHELPKTGVYMGV